MNRSACCDSNFLYASDLEEGPLEEFVAFLSKVLLRGCSIHVNQNWAYAYGVVDGPLNFGSRRISKELKGELSRVFTLMEPSADPVCSARAMSSMGLVMLLQPMQPATQDCDEETVTVNCASDLPGFESFWRSLLSEHATKSADVELVFDLAFWNIDRGPEAVNQWDNLGYSLQRAIKTIVKHVSYLNDKAQEDWRESGYHDQKFTDRASILLSRDPGSSVRRKYPDKSGLEISCLHHTKLHPDDTGNSAHYGGRIYFGLKEDGRVFLGKVCKHD